MRHVDVAIIGGGLAGSTAAAMLGRAGLSAAVIDLHRVYPPDFRCEKFDQSQVALWHKTGLADEILPRATRIDELWIARFGHLVRKRSNEQYGMYYDGMVNAMRDAIPADAEFIEGKVSAIATSADRQKVTLSSGEEIVARLIVLANGLNIGLRHNIGLTREVISPSHSVSIGFECKPVGRAAFDFPALTYYPERTSDHVAYVAFFPIGRTMRANLFVYRDQRDLWLRRMREAPQATLFEALPGLHKLVGDFEVTDAVKIRPVDLYVTGGHRQPGVVLVGDAFATSCPAAGTGTNKVLTDVERLCNVHIPRWLATEGMGADKIAAFYDDEVKAASDAFSANKAFYLRSLSIDGRLPWRARRWTRFLGQLGIGAMEQTRERLTMRLGAAAR
jgi:2-polyprenyl-6-methoxyphenol hydroxylase-like FAD-dependent oxidoreductase